MRVVGRYHWPAGAFGGDHLRGFGLSKVFGAASLPC